MSMSTCKTWCSLRADGWHKKYSASWFGFAPDEPSIHGIGMNQLFRKMETVGNSRKHDQAKTCSARNEKKVFPRNARFFLKVQRCPRETVRNSRGSHLHSAKNWLYFVAYIHEKCLDMI